MHRGRDSGDSIREAAGDATRKDQREDRRQTEGTERDRQKAHQRDLRWLGVGQQREAQSEGGHAPLIQEAEAAQFLVSTWMTGSQKHPHPLTLKITK